MFADLLQLELRRTAPGEVTALHQPAARWLAGHGYPVQAVRHAQAARDWDLAARLLADHWPDLYLGGQAAIALELLAGFPLGVRAADAQLAAVAAVAELAHGSLDAVGHYLSLAERAMTSVPDARRAQAQLLLGIAHLLVARQRADLPAVAEQARLLPAIAESSAAQPGLGEDLRALALIGLDGADIWTDRFEETVRHVERGVALAHRIGRPYLEFTGLANLAAVEVFRSFAGAADGSRQAIGLAEQHGWTDEHAAGLAYMTLGTHRQGRSPPDSRDRGLL
jgi:LuxR family maltose regulon positive regulatory protein